MRRDRRAGRDDKTEEWRRSKGIPTLKRDSGTGKAKAAMVSKQVENDNVD